MLGWTLPVQVAAALNAQYGTAFAGHPAPRIDVTVTVPDSWRRCAATHPIQAVPGSVLWRRLDLLGDREHLRWRHGHPTDNRAQPAGAGVTSVPAGPGPYPLAAP